MQICRIKYIIQNHQLIKRNNKQIATFAKTMTIKFCYYLYIGQL